MFSMDFLLWSLEHWDYFDIQMSAFPKASWMSIRFLINGFSGSCLVVLMERQNHDAVRTGWATRQRAFEQP
jgi:hypothetical protein